MDKNRLVIVNSSRRAVGNRLGGGDGAIQSLAILQHQQRNNTPGKNAADIALVIDAMDLMHKGKLDGHRRSDSGWRRFGS